MKSPFTQKRFLIGPDCKERFLPLSVPEASPLVKAGIETCGISLTKGDFDILRPNPAHAVVFCTLAGQATFKTPRKTLALCAGDILISPARLPHHYYRRAKVWEFVWFHVGQQAVWNMPSDTIQRHVEVEKVAHLKSIVTGMIDEIPMSGAEGSALSLYASLILTHLPRLMQLDQPLEEHTAEWRKKLNQAVRVVANDLGRPWTADTVAAACGTSRSHLYRLCQHHLGVSPMGMIHQLRMERAREILCNRDHKLNYIARQLGYSTSFAFSAAFKKHSGLSPTEFRATNKR